MGPTFPVHSVLDDLRDALATRRTAILQAAPGAGKTTVVPIALMEEPWLEGKKILLLEPRRLAARSAAERMAETLGEAVGVQVGYRMRGAQRIGPETRIEVITEGVLGAMLRSDPALEDVGLVIFDEFHERSLEADTGLALTLQVRQLFRDDLRLLVMSATLPEGIGRVLPEAPRIEASGKMHPVRILHRDPRAPRVTPATVADEAASETLRALKEEEGDILVFLPGMREIVRAEAILKGRVGEGVSILPLHGSLPVQAQRAVLAPAAEGGRRVVLATNVAETSLTIEGTRVVIDGGYERSVVYDPTLGFPRRQTRLISRDSATQRAGRAGRMAPGSCRRLWEEGRALPPSRIPEILRSDLSALCLELAAWGARPDELAWIDPPPEHAVRGAERILILLNMITEEGAITPYGERALASGLPPRLAHMLLEGKRMGRGYEAALLALWWQERPDGIGHGDLRMVLERMHAHIGTDRRLRRLLERILQKNGIDPSDRIDAEAAGSLTALAYPERILRRKERERFVSVAGRGARVMDGALAEEPWLAAAGMGGEGVDARVYEAAPLEETWVRERFAGMLEREERIALDKRSGRIEAYLCERFGGIELDRRPLHEPDMETVARLWCGYLREIPPERWPVGEKARRLLDRLRFAALYDPERFGGILAGLLAQCEETVGEYLGSARSVEELERIDWPGIVMGVLGWERSGELDRFAPERIEIPSGRTVRIDYTDPAHPVLAVKLQELFGWRETPRIAGGKVPLRIHLLSPAGRPVQITEDLEHFWRHGYPEVRKEMRGRYPKHPWPEDPFTATPSRGVKLRVEN
ncbi:ATP-dependent helicase HrpB [Nitratifractor sp.]